MSDSTPDLPDLPPPAPAAIGAPPPQWESEDQPINWARYVSALLRRKWLIVALTIVGTGVGYGLGRLQPLQYVAQATLWLQAGDARGATQGPIQPEQLLQWSAWVDLLKSFVVLDEVVRRQHLYLERHDLADSAVFAGFELAPRFVPAEYRLQVSGDGRTFTLTSQQRQIQRGNVGDSVGSNVGFEWRPSVAELRAGRLVRFRVRTPREAALQLQANLKAVLPEEGSFLRLELQGTDPTATAQTVNSVAERFVDVAAELKRQKLTELSGILRDQLNSAYADLGRAESALESFRVHTITLPSEQASPVTPGLEQTRDPVFRSFFEMRVQRDQLDRDRQAIRQALAPSDSGISFMALEAIPSVRESAELSQALNTLASKEAEASAMRLQFGGSYPPLQRLQAEVQDLRQRSVPTLALKLAAELDAQVRDMDARIGSASHELQQIPARVIEEARLRRDVAISENLYTTLQQRYEEARLAEVSSIPDVRILDNAMTPERPLKNRAMMLLLGGLFGGLGGAVVLVIALDQLDRRVRYPDQVSAEMGLPILGVVPRLKNGSRFARGETEAQVVEALRTIRLNLQHAYGAVGPLVVTITSPGSGDGKSFLSSNLAVAFADAGHRTLVIDADIRRGALHRVFDRERKPGLLDHLSGSVSREAIVQSTPIKGVDFIGGGSRKTAGPELLASSAMSQLLIGLRSAYGVIILDSAPLGAGVDALIVGALTGNMVLVVRSGVTDKALAAAKLDDVNRLPIRMLGAIINDVKPQGVYGYYASYGYLSGYGTSEESEHSSTKPKRLKGKG